MLAKKIVAIDKNTDVVIQTSEKLFALNEPEWRSLAALMLDEAMKEQQATIGKYSPATIRGERAYVIGLVTDLRKEAEANLARLITTRKQAN